MGKKRLAQALLACFAGMVLLRRRGLRRGLVSGPRAARWCVPGAYGGIAAKRRNVVRERTDNDIRAIPLVAKRRNVVGDGRDCRLSAKTRQARRSRGRIEPGRGRRGEALLRDGSAT